MRRLDAQIRLSATDLSNHLACRHVTSLDLQVARGEKPAPDWAAPDLYLIRELGRRHEAEYLRFLEQDKKLSVVNLGEIEDESELLGETRRLMEQGAEVIAQGGLSHERWFGRPDVLLRVPAPGGRWNWSYQVQDTKLSKETKATTILQLSLYSELLKRVQESDPEFMWVVAPGSGFAGECYRVAEYSAYFRYVKRELVSATENHREQTYPEPVPHCDVCRWFRECDRRRRGDDHLSLVAGIRRQQRNQLEQWNTGTMAKLAVLPVPLKQKPKHGSREGLERVREQARVQVEGRTLEKPVHEALPVAAGAGFSRLPEPSPADMFVDLEGDPFVGEGGQQYLFGFVAGAGSGELVYENRWALTADEEKQGFEWLMDEMARRRTEVAGMHVYHFGANEPSTFKRLMGRYATREEAMDSMLRAGLFVDLHQLVKQSVRASVEEYSLKNLEAFHGFERKTSLDESRAAMRYIEHRLELEGRPEKLPGNVRQAMEGYNKEDCLSTAALRDWLEGERKNLIRAGAEIPRPIAKDGAPSEELSERQKRVAALAAELTAGLPNDPAERNREQQARWLLAQLLDWHRREDKATWWEGFRLADLDDEDLLEERAGLAGLRLVQRMRHENKIPVDRYAFERQETEVQVAKDLYHRGERFGSVAAVNLAERTVDVKKTRKTAELHPTGVYLWERPYNVEEQAEAISRIAERVAKKGIDAKGEYRAARDLLLRRGPRLEKGQTLERLLIEAPAMTAARIAGAMKETVFAIQGPPGAGKTYTGARMICQLVKEGKKIGITALSHKVIRKLLEEVVLAAKADGIPGLRCMQRWEKGEASEDIMLAENSTETLRALQSGTANVVGGTSFMWAPKSFFAALDVLFIDEAGQMALADVISVAQAARDLVLIGDPQQLQRPLKGSHPDGAEKSALQHLLGDHKTISPETGLLLPETWRLHPKICEFTSELFYEGRLRSREVLRNSVLQGHAWLAGAGLWFVPVPHVGNRNSSAEEVQAIARIVGSLRRPEVQWFDGVGNSRPLEAEDILIVAPYNAQVADLSAGLPDGKIGTVDKFQGQEAPVVIYSLTTSSPEDAPRGMEFLYSLNRLNVATSRAKTAVILVGSPRLFEPECRSPRQMQLANAACRYLEMAQTVSLQQVMAI